MINLLKRFFSVKSIKAKTLQEFASRVKRESVSSVTANLMLTNELLPVDGPCIELVFTAETSRKRNITYREILFQIESISDILRILAHGTIREECWRTVLMARERVNTLKEILPRNIPVCLKIDGKDVPSFDRPYIDTRSGGISITL